MESNKGRLTVLPVKATLRGMNTPLTFRPISLAKSVSFCSVAS